MSRNGTTEERFWKKVNKNGPNGCWLWIGWAQEGYGRLTDEAVGKEVGAHRYSYKLHKGDPGPLLVCHTCDVTLCVNPDHLYAGTQKQNMEDMVARKRQNKAKGVNAARSKLTESIVLEIRKDLATGMHDVAIMAKHGTSRGNIYAIKNRTTWKHI